MAEALVQRALSGDVDAFMWLAEPVEARLYRLALGLTHSVPTATELSVAAVAAAYLRLREYRGKTDLRRWLLRVGVAELLGLIRRSRQPASVHNSRLPALPALLAAVGV